MRPQHFYSTQLPCSKMWPYIWHPVRCDHTSHNLSGVTKHLTPYEVWPHISHLVSCLQAKEPLEMEHFLILKTISLGNQEFSLTLLQDVTIHMTLCQVWPYISHLVRCDHTSNNLCGVTTHLTPYEVWPHIWHLVRCDHTSDTLYCYC